MAELLEHGLSFTEQKPSGSHKLGKRAVVIGAGIGGLATAGALAPYFEQVDILERDRLAATAGSRCGSPRSPGDGADGSRVSRPQAARISTSAANST